MVGYDFYAGQYLGDSISEKDWPMYGKRAAEVLNRYKRIYTVIESDAMAENMAVCAMADALFYFANAQNGTAAVASASIGSVSVSYNAPKSVDLSPKAQERELFRCASQYLEIYRGVG